MKYTPSAMVMDSAWIMCFRSPSIRLCWAQVMDTPEARRIEVFSRGTSRGFSG